MRQLFSGIEQQAVLDCDPWEIGNIWVEFLIALAFPLGALLGHSTGNGVSVQQALLTEQKRQKVGVQGH
jgi:hypothetical protein